MASVIKPKRSAVANTPPTTANIEQYEIAINTADKKIYTRDGSDNILVIGAGNVSGLADVSVSTPAAGQLLVYNSGTNKWTNGSSIGTAISITDSTASSSTTTGALKITGGVGIGGQLWVGQGSTNGLRTTNLQIYDDGNPHISSLTGNLWLNSPDTDKVAINTQSNGSVQLAKAGGGNVQVLSTTASTSTASGALVVAGGIGIAGAAYIGGVANFKGEVLIDNASGSGGSTEGGELHFAVPTSGSTLSGPIAIDIYQNKLRIFETTGTNRGVYIDLTAAGASVGTNLLTGGGGGSGTVTSVALTVPTGLSVSGSPITSSGTLAVTLQTGYSIPTTASQTNWDTAYSWGNHASAGYLTSGTAATTYQPLDADLTSIAGLTGTTGILKKTAADTWSLDTSTYLTGNQTITLSGDVTGSGSTAITTTLANSGVTAGSYTLASITVDAKGRITAASSGSAGASLTGKTDGSTTYDTFLGEGTPTSLTSGSQNVAVGYQALTSSTGGTYYNIAVGYRTLASATDYQASGNVAIGWKAMESWLYGTSNVAIGENTLNNTGGGDYNVAIGSTAGFGLTGSNNVFIGSEAGRYSAYAASNVFIGVQSGFNNTTGGNNVALGRYSLRSSTTSSSNVALGYAAGYATTGAQNTLIGTNAAYSGTNNLTSGSNNIVIGYYAEASSATASNEITLGNSSITRLRIPGLGIDWTSATVPTGGGGGGGTSITNTIVTTTTQTAVKDNRYILTNASATTVTLPATPTLGDTVYIIVANGLTTNVIARNGSPIMGLAEDLTVDGSTASFGLFYVNSTLGWRII